MFIDVLLSISWSLVFYLSTCMVACFIHIANKSRTETGYIDLLKLTFLPYVIYCLVWDKEKLK
uniref:Uncharacterized protein n=1 Tax=viral metagenome TaxID=1070528 RepID=A0A6M3ITN0_9ZZZZ